MALRGEISVPGDKSISHRAVIVNAVAQGSWTVENLLESEDVGRSMELVRAVGVKVEKRGERFCFESPGRGNFMEPEDVIYAGNSGTTIRIGAGLLASIDGYSVITGDEYLRRRPMERIAVPLRMMGAVVDGRDGGRYPPLTIRGGRLKGIFYEMPVASAQVKSSILVAGACAGVKVSVVEPVPTRDHTERMLVSMGAEIEKSNGMVSLRDTSNMKPVDMVVPGDFSSAAFFIAGALITPGSSLRIENVLLNPLRTGFLRVLERMGGSLEIENPREISGEPVGDIIVSYTENLKGISVFEEEIPSLIDEVPILSVVAAFAEGFTEIRGASELRVKESDRIAAMVSNLREFGVKVEELPDGMVIEGGGSYRPIGVTRSYGDHRVVMAMEIFAVALGVELEVDDRRSVSTSFPDFYEILKEVRK